MKQLLHHSATQDFYTMRGRHIERLRVGWTIRDNGHINGFARFGGKAGNGAIAMRAICAVADKWGIHLTLHADNDRLCDWYEQFGFLRCSADSRSMERQRVFRNMTPAQIKDWYATLAKWVPNDYDHYQRGQMRHYQEHPRS